MFHWTLDVYLDGRASPFPGFLAAALYGFSLFVVLSFEPPTTFEMKPATDPTQQPERFFRPLRVFAFDPSRGSRLGNVMTIRVPYEPLSRGPIGERVAVIDYDGSRDRFYPPVDLDHPLIFQENGLEPRDSDPRFHQQMVYAVVSQTLRTFDRALGRQVRFRAQRGPVREGRDRVRLRVYPHGIDEANAFYSRELRGLVFGYFPAVMDDAGANIPGQPIFTCLSHDIIVHETCHAVVDGMREYFLEPTNRDSLAFHEALADVIALLQHFTFPEPLLDAIQRTGGQLSRPTLAPEMTSDGEGAADGADAIESNPLVDLALQFGESMGTRGALRSAIRLPPRRRDIESVNEPHERGAILVAAIFEAFFRVYTRRTRDLFRLAGIGADHHGELHPDLAQRLCVEATTLADQFVLLCIRAIEYSPPVDLEFGDFLRALLTVHTRLDSDDADGYRDALIRAFARRGIFPPDVRALTQSELIWCPPPTVTEAPLELMEALRRSDRDDGPNQRKIAALLHRFCHEHRGAFGLNDQDRIAVRTFHHHVRLLGPESEDVQDFVCEVTQTRKTPLFTGARETVPLRGGTTLVIRHDGRVRYAIAKQLHNRRIRAQLEYANNALMGTAQLYGEKPNGPDLRALHRGY
jgi:hypothetical protein